MATSATFDIVDYPHPVSVTIVRDGRPQTFQLPYTTEVEKEKEILRSHPGVVEVGKPAQRKGRIDDPRDQEPGDKPEAKNEQASDAPETPDAMRGKGGDQ